MEEEEDIRFHLQLAAKAVEEEAGRQPIVSLCHSEDPYN